MVEVVIALVILAVGILGMAGSTAHIVRQITLADLMTERSVAFQTIIDRLQSLPYDSVGSGSDSVGVFYLRWSSTPDGAQTKMVRIWTQGPGMGGTTSRTNNPQKLDSFDFRVLRR
jgi:Tfp pilus assembly protein PilV